MKEKDEYDMLEYRYLNTRAKRGGAPKVEKKPDVETKAEDKVGNKTVVSSPSNIVEAVIR